ncbi:bifunctional protein biotin operon repressor/biotin--[acetyl-CoA-carboxylase] synthetase BirA [Gottschalkia acidurici 9a]|uniref:Bifunctional ligase/repressor BirA n=1 Tax=Gottschalkia acidurici (strain ATCC 7906 / DSM 604 / BCRC 14475 / CIP 104303 / KCTC 5404 / NCIMB 10678 / 9a) TaxID=1128398 RepID=K0B489_GOTA9|nr:biotin--[acetyl-CoA-carboxylase] ligase [Gottschalkia acidurici]AFS79361.1 bifunctional protein biotin operon repressor/biotin--[acetyl-CoA-carboxylase] synthetase BirA [Gottschalkia acidurici 9a]
MREKILKVLKEKRGEFVSGQDLSNKLNVSRTAIWKYINILKEEGYSIESITRKGHRLLSSPDVLSEEEVKEYLKTKYIGRNILYYDSIDSTNNEAKNIASKGNEEGTVVIAEEQIQGRGRLGKNWTSPKGKGIWMSIVVRPDIEPMDASKITQITAASVYRAMKEMEIEVSIKWPNDIILNGKKVCGILTEMSGEMMKINYLVIGIGVNVNIEDDEFPDEVKEKATSLKRELGKTINRKALVGKILNNFEYFYEEMTIKNNIEEAINICREKSILIGKKVRVIQKNQELERVAVGLTDDGELLVKDEDGNITKLISGEVSVRGEKGYV